MIAIPSDRLKVLHSELTNLQQKLNVGKVLLASTASTSPEEVEAAMMGIFQVLLPLQVCVDMALSKSYEMESLVSERLEYLRPSKVSPSVDLGPLVCALQSVILKTDLDDIWSSVHILIHQTRKLYENFPEICYDRSQTDFFEDYQWQLNRKQALWQGILDQHKRQTQDQVQKERLPWPSLRKSDLYGFIRPKGPSGLTFIHTSEGLRRPSLAHIQGHSSRQEDSFVCKELNVSSHLLGPQEVMRNLERMWKDLVLESKTKINGSAASFAIMWDKQIILGHYGDCGAVMFCYDRISKRVSFERLTFDNKDSNLTCSLWTHHEQREGCNYFLLLSTDGVWAKGKVKERDMAQKLEELMVSNPNYETSGFSALDLIEVSLEHGSVDNITTFLIPVAPVITPVLYGVFDGHGDITAAQEVAKIISEKLETQIAKNYGLKLLAHHYLANFRHSFKPQRKTGH